MVSEVEMVSAEEHIDCSLMGSNPSSKNRLDFLKSFRTETEKQNTRCVLMFEFKFHPSDILPLGIIYMPLGIIKICIFFPLIFILFILEQLWFHTCILVEHAMTAN